MVKEQANANLNAKLEFTDLSLSMLRSFPALSIRIDELSLSGINEFEKDTLVKFNYFQTDVSLGSVIFGDQIEIKAISLDKPIVNAIVLENGKANWDIAKEDTTAIEEEVDTLAEPTKFSIGLKKFEIIEAKIKYDDRASKMKAKIDTLDFLLKGDLSESETSLDIKTSIAQLSFFMDGIKYLNKAKLSFKSDFKANMDSMAFTFKENEFGINEIILGFDGFIKMPGDDIDMDITFKTKKTEFKSVLSLVPIVYMQDFSGLKTSGKFDFNGYARGVFNDNSLPAFGLKLNVENGMFKYPDLPKAVNNVNIDLKVDNKGGSGDINLIDLKKAHLELGTNPVDANMFVSTTADDVDMKGKLKAKIDLNTLQDVVPLDSMTIKGIIDVNLDIAGKLSSIENENYDKFKADGKIELTTFEFASTDLPKPVTIPSAIMRFTPAYVSLDKFDVNIGSSDVHLDGKMDNLLPYVLQDSTLVARFNFTSANLDMTDLMSEGDDLEEPQTIEEPESTDTIPMTAFEIPSNIDFLLKSDLKKIKYDNLNITNLNGDIILKDSKAMFRKVKMNLLDGNMLLDGSYDSKILKEPKVAFIMDINSFNIPAAFEAFNTVKQLAPIAKNTKGKFSLLFDFNSSLDYHLNPVYETLNGKGRFQSKEIAITQSNALSKLSSVTKWKKLENPSLKDVDLKFSIEKGNITVDPTKMKLGKTEMEFGGSQNLNKEIDYKIGMNIPRKELGETVNKVVDNLIAKTGKEINVAENIKMNVFAKGTIDDPKFSLKGDKNQATSIKEDIKKEIKQGLSDEAKKLIADADKKAKEIISAAEKEAQKIKDEAKKAGDKLITEADKQGEKLKTEAKAKSEQLIAEADKKADDLVASAKNPLAKIGAEKTAKKMKEEARKSAEKINIEADKSAQKLHDEAQTKADQLNNEADKKADALVANAEKEADAIKNKADEKAESMSK